VLDAFRIGFDGTVDDRAGSGLSRSRVEAGSPRRRTGPRWVLPRRGYFISYATRQPETTPPPVETDG
jgi:hypothetical protein